MKIFTTNQNKSERIVRFIISIFLLPTPVFLGQSNYSIFLCVIGGILLFNSIVGTCMIYKLFGVDTCKIKSKYLILIYVRNSIWYNIFDIWRKYY